MVYFLESLYSRHNVALLAVDFLNTFIIISDDHFINISRMTDDSTQIFVARLPRDTRLEDVEAVFRKYGPLQKCNVRSGTLCFVFMNSSICRWGSLLRICAL